MIVILTLLYVLIALTVMTVWFVFDPNHDETDVMLASIIWPIAISVVLLMLITHSIKILVNKIRKKYVSDE